MLVNCEYEWGCIVESVMMSHFGYESAIYINIQIPYCLLQGKESPCQTIHQGGNAVAHERCRKTSSHVTSPQTKHVLLTPKNKNKNHAMMIQCNNINFIYIPTLAPCEPPFTSTPSYTPPYPSTFISLSPNSSSCSSVLSYSSIVRLGSGSGA